MDVFTITNLSLGIVHSGVEVTMHFPYKGIQKVVSAVSPCDCSIPTNDAVNSRITVKYVPKRISQTLLNKGIHEQTVQKNITIKYISQETGKEAEETLVFRATVKN